MIKSKKKKWSKSDTDFFSKQWRFITEKKQTDPLHAIMDADKLIDKALSKKGYQGSLGEKLKKAKSLFSDNNGLWQAHKLRNQIAHELDIKLKPQQVESALRSFRKALQDLGLGV
jgi:hypothetical protein